MGVAWKFGNNVNTDQIIPGRYYPRENVKELGEFCLCELNPEFAKEKKEGDVIVAGENFGCGSSREYAPLALKHAGLKCVIAKSFARIFYRNCVNIGFPILVCGECYTGIKNQHKIEVDLERGKIKNQVSGREFSAEPLPGFALKIVKSNGIVNFLKKRRDLK